MRPRALVGRLLLCGVDDDGVGTRIDGGLVISAEPPHDIWRGTVRRTDLGDLAPLIRLLDRRALDHQPVAHLGLHRPLLPSANRPACTKKLSLGAQALCNCLATPRDISPVGAVRMTGSNAMTIL